MHNYTRLFLYICLMSLLRPFSAWEIAFKAYGVYEHVKTVCHHNTRIWNWYFFFIFLFLRKGFLVSNHVRRMPYAKALNSSLRSQKWIRTMAYVSLAYTEEITFVHHTANSLFSILALRPYRAALISDSAEYTQRA